MWSKRRRKTSYNGRKRVESSTSTYDRANILSVYMLTYMLPLFRKAKKQLITSEDLGAPPSDDRSQALGAKLQQAYSRQQQRPEEETPSLARCLLKVVGWRLFLFTILSTCSECIANPMTIVSMGWLIRDCGTYYNIANPSTDTAAAAAAAAAAAELSASNDYVEEEGTRRHSFHNHQNDNNNNNTSYRSGSPIEFLNAARAHGLTRDEAYWSVVYDALTLIAFQTLALAVGQPYFFQTSRIGMKCRVAACSLIYKKALRLSQGAMSETTVGQMVNLLSNDVNRFDTAAQFMPYLINAPLQAIVALSIMSIFYLGLYPTLASLAAILCYLFISTLMGRGFSKYRSKTAARTDERMRLMNEIILAMKIIKMYAWEEPFKALVHEARRRETSTIGVSYVLKAINQTLFFSASKIIVFVALITYVMLGYPLQPEIVFVAIGLALPMRIVLTMHFPTAIAFTAEALVSCKRIDDFLALPEEDTFPANYEVASTPAADARDGAAFKYAVSMNKVSASWVSKQDNDKEQHSEMPSSMSVETRHAVIRDLTLAIKPRDLVLIVGRVGSGKSSVLMALLGELPVASGRISINGRLAYASQEAWIFSGSVRDNILFGKPYERDRYAEVVRVCSLQRDLELLVDGDATLVGERGVSLSGGQKARVNLARALYQDADIYLLDDPLSAVDAPVAKFIFSESIRTFLRKKTVILATHQLQFLRYATKVLVVDRNSPAAFGTLEDVMQSEAFALIGTNKEAFQDASKREESAADDSTPSSDPTADGRDPPLRAGESQASLNLAESVKHLQPPLVTGAVGKKPSASDAATPERTTHKGADQRKGAERLSDISANFATYLYYIRMAAGPVFLAWFLLTNVVAQTLFQGTDYFLSLWTDSRQRRYFQGANFVPASFVDKLSLVEISGIYAGLVGLLLLAAFVRVVTFFVGAFRASIRMHRKLFNCIVHAPMSFYDFSPIGILLNRFSRDIGFVDETLPATTCEITMILFDVAGIIVLAIFVDYKNLVAAVLLIALAVYVRSLCAGAVLRLKSIEGVTKSPLFSHLSTTLAGLSTIRTCKAQEQFAELFDELQDSHTSAWFNFLSASRWLELTLDWASLLFSSIVIIILVTLSLDALSASLVGLLVSQLVELRMPFRYGMNQLIQLESQMTSVQRIKEFSEMQSESELLMSDGLLRGFKGAEEPRDDTFSELLQGGGGGGQAGGGQVKFVNVSLRYFPDEPPVLKRLNFTVEPREKIGIVGRTGAGKSSIVSVLFRLYDFEGRVEIDGRDTKLMRLEDVRRAMSIIPQDPILFGASIRKNLDPFGEHSDKQLWQALEAVQLQQVFARHAQGLEYAITEGGSNFSVGQRQLICLARAIVRRTKILVLDEATANVDPETDAFIQRTIARQFANCTVLTIAHRLITIVDSDRVLVLDGGEISEFGAPHELLANERGIFAQMVASSAQQAPRIVKLIEEAAHKRRHKRRQSSTSSQEEQ